MGSWDKFFLIHKASFHHQDYPQVKSRSTNKAPLYVVQVSILKVLVIAGLHELPLTSALGSFNGMRKNLTRIVQDGTVPLLRPFILAQDVVCVYAYSYMYMYICLHGCVHVA